MNLFDALNSKLATGEATSVKGPASAQSPYPIPTRSFKRSREPKMIPVVIFHPEALTLKDTQIDIQNPEQAGKWFPTTAGTLVCHRFVASPEVKDELAECIRQIEVLRLYTAKKESYLIGKMFALAEASRPSIVDLHLAPVAVTRSLELAMAEMELSYEDPTLLEAEAIT